MNVPIGQFSGSPIDPRPSRDAEAGDRLDGWKVIAAHFGRDRTTVIRWARERSLPVHRLPGGRTGTVYALKHELDRWAGITHAVETAPVAPSPAPAFAATGCGSFPSVSLKRRNLARRWLLAGAVALVGAASIPNTATPAVLPNDPIVADRFLTARDLVADREADGLERAIGLLDDVTRKSPRFAPGYAALAEALILSREFGKLQDSDAFLRARHAARTANRIDPSLAAGHRMLGFIAYWADRDFVEAQARFRDALRLDPGDALSHFWYGNILSDHGDHDAGLAALGRARLMQPGSAAIRTDLAWALWAAGDDAAAIASLTEIVRRNPDFAVAHDCLAIIALLQGESAAYVRHFAEFARSRGDVRLLARAARLKNAQGSGAAAVHREALDQALQEVGEGTRNRIWAITIASVAGDRNAVIRLLQQADRDGEHWGEAGLVSRLRKIWQGDLLVTRLIDARSTTAKVAAKPM